MEVTLRDEARAEAEAEAVEAVVREYGRRLSALQNRLDDLVLQIGVVQAELVESGVAAAQAEIQELWIIMYSVDRRFKDLLA